MLWALSAGSPVSHQALAADFPTPMEYQVTTESGFEFNIVPLYLWLPGVNGTVGVLGSSVEVDLAPIDIISNLGDFLKVLDGVYMGAGEVRYGDFGLVYDVFYLDVSSTAEIDLGGIVTADTDVAFSQVMATVLGSYRAIEGHNMYVDLLGGVRINDVRIDIDVNFGIGDGFELSDGATWVDPIFGAKGRMDFNENWYANGTALIGGFGVSSDFVWDVSANLGYQWNDWLDVYAGFRGTGTDYKSGSFIWDVTQYGPVIGASIKLN
ncbi:MAG: hypothetical protein V2I51_00160 [Anderseniella sp.]|jgi:hypothetical protein|nr:hypothetical protein [Anderseniella sp.]